MVREQRPALDVVAPVAVQFAGHAEPAHQLGAGGLHPRPGRSRGLVERPRRVGDNEDLETLFERRERGKATQTSVTTPAMISCFCPSPSPP